MKRILSLGAGVQSTALALLARDGTIPPWDVCVFADTGWEPKFVYDHLDRLEGQLTLAGIPLTRVSAGNLRDDTFTKKSVSPPVWVRKADGQPGGPGFRGCTDRYKVRPIEKWMRSYAEIPRGCKELRVLLGIGISTDEQLRERTAKHPWIRNNYPLLDLGWSRDDCVAYLDSVGWGSTPKSACLGCPYHSDALWAQIKTESPDDWEDACRFDEKIREGTMNRDEGGTTFFLHRKLIPLRDVTLEEGSTVGEIGCSPYACPGNLVEDVDYEQLTLPPEFLEGWVS